MGSLKIDFIERDNTTQSNYLYSDVHLDLENDYKRRGNSSKSETYLADIKVSYDIDAITNSLTNLFSTNKGQRLLLPEYGVNILDYIFLPVSDATARVIGELLLYGVEQWEPRVEVREVTVVPRKNDHRYDIDMDIYIPSLKQSATFLGSVLEGKGFVRS